jgi:hypothetical protein
MKSARNWQGDMTAYEVAVTASLMTGVLMIGTSLLFIYKGVLKLTGKQTGDTSISFKSLKFSTHYPALALFLLGGAFLVYPLYLTSKDGLERVTLRLQVQVKPESDISDVRVKIYSLGPSAEEMPDSDGKMFWGFEPKLRKVRLEILAPGRKSLIKTITIKKDGTDVDLGVLTLPEPSVRLQDIVGDSP